jgi:hypothetical protein
LVFMDLASVEEEVDIMVEDVVVGLVLVVVE